MEVEYVDPPVEKDEISVWNNYGHIKFRVRDANNKVLVIGWKQRSGVHVIVWRLDYSQTERCLYSRCKITNPDAEKCSIGKNGNHKTTRSGFCWEKFNSADDIVSMVSGW